MLNGNLGNETITYQSVPDQSVPDQSVPHKGSRKKGSRSNFGTFLVRPEQFSKSPKGDALNVHKSRMYTNQDIHMGVWDHMKCIPTGLPNLKECPPGHIIHPGIVSSGHSVSGHSVTRGIVSLRGNVSPGAYCPSRRMSPVHSVFGACRLGPSHLHQKIIYGPKNWAQIYGI